MLYSLYSSMAEIYGVNPDSEITPEQVRDAIILCIQKAQEEMFAVDKGDYSDAQIKAMSSPEAAKQFVQQFFDKIGATFEKPRKADLKKLVEAMKEHMVKFKDPSIPKKHATVIMKLIDKL
jgi:hypothetical protein